MLFMNCSQPFKNEKKPEIINETKTVSITLNLYFKYFSVIIWQFVNENFIIRNCHKFWLVT